MVYHRSPIMYHFSSSLCLFIHIILLLLHNNGCSACFQPERDALLELRASFSSNGGLYSDALVDWIDGKNPDCCVWSGVECDNVTHRVIQLGLSNLSGLRQLLNTSLFLPFEYLRSLDLSINPITGWVTNEGLERFSKLSNLEHLHLGYTALNARSLESVNLVTSLKELYLDRNLIEEFPKGICELKKLEELDLSDNQIEGVLHPCLFQNLTRLIYLDLSSNKLTGIIPLDLLSNMTSLEFNSHSHNHFDKNTLMTSSHHTQFQLSILLLSYCNLNISTTHLQKYLKNHYNLKEVDLSHNTIHGNYPNWLVENNTRLVSLVLASNSLDGFVHFPVNSGKNMRRIDISDNQIQGQLQTNIGEVFQNIEFLDLSKNYFEGKIPTSLLNLTNLGYLSLSTNHFSGDLSPISRIFSATHSLIKRISFKGIRELDISRNYILGKIPLWMANLTNLQSLNLRGNFFNGLFPSEFCNLSQLKSLDIAENELSGSIPSCLNLTSIEFMYLDRNKFSGSLPKFILNHKNLILLNLNYNNLTGVIPKWLCLLPNLSILLLKGNTLSGSIPQEFCGLSNIGILDLSSNILSGILPPCLSALSFGKFSLFDYRFSFDHETQNYVDFESKIGYDYCHDKHNCLTKMDLSNNYFKGNIPPDFGALIFIEALNLSYNQFTGSIPKALSKMTMLKSMDLSHNNLSGEIPTKLISITTLVVFTVAYNKLFGPIPNNKAQFNTFDETSYQGNPSLCGPPLQSSCINNDKNYGMDERIKSRTLWNKYGIDSISFLVSFVVAYIMYLAIFVVVLYINPYCRSLWFHLIDRCINFVFTLF